MSNELTLEQLADKIDTIEKTASKLFKAMDEKKEHKESNDDKEKEKEAAFRKAQEEIEDKEKQHEAQEDELKKVKEAFKKAQEEEDPEKKKEAMRVAMDMKEEHEKKEGFGKPKKGEDEKSDEEKEKEAQVASIINEKKNSLINQILTANRIINPNGVKEVESRLKKASISDIEKEYSIVKPFIAGVEPTKTKQDPVIPYFASINPADIDESQLTASSPDSEFNKLSTKELLEDDY